MLVQLLSLCHRRRRRSHSVDDCGLFVVDAMLFRLSSLHWQSTSSAEPIFIVAYIACVLPCSGGGRLMLGNNLCTSIVSATVLRQIFWLRLWPPSPPPHGKRDVLCNDEAILSIVEFVRFAIAVAIHHHSRSTCCACGPFSANYTIPFKRSIDICLFHVAVAVPFDLFSPLVLAFPTKYVRPINGPVRLHMTET